MNKITGRPAFPSTITDDSLHVQGMTLRDYFAAKALQGFLAAEDTGWENHELADACYKAADAMLKAREK
jgi:hypothetical protein